MSMVPRGKNGRYAKWTEADYNNVYPDRTKAKTTDVPEPTSREEFTDYVKANHTAESNRNEELVTETIDFTGTDMVRKEQIAATIADNFTKEEIGKMTEKGGLEIIHGEKVVDNKRADASHRDRTEHNAAEVRIDDDADATAITHELVHHLRTEDEDRHGLDKTAYSLDENGHVVSDSKTDRNRFAEECAVIAETEIRTKEATDRPNVNLGKLDRQVGDIEESNRNERITMRTRSDAIKPNENIPVFNGKSTDAAMAEGTNLRGRPALKMFDRNFRRSRLGNPPKYAGTGEKSNIELIEDNHRKGEIKTDE